LNNLYHTQWRETDLGASANGGTVNTVSYPDAWIRLIRQGNAFTTMIKTNGTDWMWTYTYTPTNPYPSDVLLGLAVTAHDNALTATGMFNGFSVTAPVTDLAVSNSASAGVVPVGGTITYTITVRNQGAATPGVVVTDPLPAGVSYTGSTASVGTAVHSSGTVTWTVGSLASGASATLTITATANTGGTTVNTASATGGLTDENPANNSATATVLVPTPPTLTNPVLSGGTFSVSVATEAGASYLLQYVDKIEDTNWQTVATVAGDGSVKILSDPNPPPGQRFYRIVVR
jgi:uncharacterized repeat protein (TIGR01451 family)